jgi:hypothetical protein
LKVRVKLVEVKLLIDHWLFLERRENNLICWFRDVGGKGHSIFRESNISVPEAVSRRQIILILVPIREVSVSRKRHLLSFLRCRESEALFSSFIINSL